MMTLRHGLFFRIHEAIHTGALVKFSRDWMELGARKTDNSEIQMFDLSDFDKKKLHNTAFRAVLDDNGQKIKI